MVADRGYTLAVLVHEVEVVTSGRDALARIAARPFDAIVCDLMVPERSGIQLLEAVRERDPRLARRMGFLTGGAFTPEATAFLGEARVHHMAKPFEPVGLRAFVDRLLRAA
jgi:CheY-like chemotaxis protein